MRNNKISVIESGTFDHLTDLNILDISYNKLTSFYEITNAVESTECANNLGIQKLKASYNKLNNLNCIRKMVNLTMLDLAGNKLMEVSAADFIHLTEISFLDLSFNNIKDLNLQALSLMHLNELRVDHLVKYDNLHDVLPKLTTLSLLAESWNCSFVYSVVEILQKQRIEITLNSLSRNISTFACPTGSYALTKIIKYLY